MLCVGYMFAFILKALLFESGDESLEKAFADGEPVEDHRLAAGSRLRFPGGMY